MGVEAVWWVGLAGAALGWLVLLKSVLIAHRILVHTLVLAHMTRDTARSVAENLRAAAELAAVDSSSDELRDRIRGVAAGLATLEGALGRLPGIRGSGVR